MTYLLDTNALSDFMKEESKIRQWMESLPSDARIVTCVTAKGEVLFGIDKLDAGKRQRVLAELARVAFELIECLATPVAAAGFYSTIKVARKLSGRPILENDCWIAATALAVGATLVTRDRDFVAIEGLSVVQPLAG